jgi:ABC-type Na+ efflux pump permease subunit
VAEAGTLAIISAVAGGIGTAISAVGAYNNAQAQAAQARYQAQVAQNNATIARQNAEYATKAGQAAATDASLRARAAVGKVVADEAASGVDVNSGSPVDAAVTEREVGKLNTERVVNNAALQAYGYRTQETNFLAQEGMYKAAADNASASALPSAFGTLFNGISSLGSNWQRFQSSGLGAGGGGAAVSTAGGYNGVDYGLTP